MRGVVFIGGDGPDPNRLADELQQADLVVAADSGLEHALAAGAEVDLVVGDMDSLADQSLLDRYPAHRVLRFPPEKDETDAEIGLRVLQERGCAEATIIGGGGGRLDHLLAVASLFERVRPPRRWMTEREDVHLVSAESVFTGWRGSTVSVFALGEGASGLSSTGLRWPLAGVVLRRAWPGVSNVADADEVRIGVGRGRLLVLRSWREDPDA